MFRAWALRQPRPPCQPFIRRWVRGAVRTGPPGGGLPPPTWETPARVGEARGPHPQARTHCCGEDGLQRSRLEQPRPRAEWGLPSTRRGRHPRPHRRAPLAVSSSSPTPGRPPSDPRVEPRSPPSPPHPLTFLPVFSSSPPVLPWHPTSPAPTHGGGVGGVLSFFSCKIKKSLVDWGS